MKSLNSVLNLVSYGNYQMHNYYLKVKENPKIGYIRRLKNYWEKLHPEFKFLSYKNCKN